MDFVRLACVKHAASVHPEPGSNSPTKTWPILMTHRSERSDQQRVSDEHSTEWKLLVCVKCPAVCGHSASRTSKLAHSDERPVFVLLPAGRPTAKLTDSFSRQPKGCRLNCPHWRSVFSSVFKEPKLGMRSPCGETPDGALIPFTFPWPGRPREAKCKANAPVTSPQPRSRKNLDEVVRLLPLAQKQVLAV
jgi:hypothetical protein